MLSELISTHKDKVPNDFEALVSLPGVGRKTASVIVGNAFGIPAIAVDTHVKRLSNLLGFIKSEDAEKIEHPIERIVSGKRLGNFVSSSRNTWQKYLYCTQAECLECVLGDLCPSYTPNNVKSKRL